MGGKERKEGVFSCGAGRYVRVREGREKPFGVRAAEACVVQTLRAWRAGGAESCALPRMKCRCGDRGRNEGRGGYRNEKDRFVRIDPSWSSEAGD